MCIYDNTLFNCGASLRHLVQLCPSESCLPHIRWVEYQSQNCRECPPLPQGAMGAISEARLIRSACNTCAQTGDLPSPHQATIQAETLQEFDKFVSEDDWEQLGPEHTSKAEGKESGEVITRVSNTLSLPLTPSPKGWVEPLMVFDGWPGYEELGGNELDDDGRKLLAEILPDDNGGVEDCPERGGEKSTGNVPASVQSHKLTTDSEQSLESVESAQG